MDVLKSVTDQRPFTMIYDDFLDSDKLTANEKLVYICIKRFTNSETLQAFPSYDRLVKMTGLSRSTVIRCVRTMREKNVLSVESRKGPDNGSTSNLYTLYDQRAVWRPSKDDLTDEEREEQIRVLEEQIRELKDHEKTENPGKKESDTDGHRHQTRSDNKISNKSNNKSEGSKSQRYPLEYIREKYNYRMILTNQNLNRNNIDSVMQILCDTLNSGKKTVRVKGENIPAGSVKKRLLDLKWQQVQFVIESYEAQSGEIKWPEAYILTALYTASEQYALKEHNKQKTEHADSVQFSRKNSFNNVPRTNMDYEKFAAEEEMDKVLNGFD